ncbi:hypothetical protein FC758_01295 [Clostridium botulinum]|nr:hypothetical protein [Clostridium botulinum]
MKKLIAIFISGIFLVSFAGCGGNSSSKTTLHSGESLTLSKDAPVCSSKENVKKMISFINEKNDDGQNRMISNGEAKILSKGTKVDIVKIGATVEMETSDNKKWFAPIEVVK